MQCDFIELDKKLLQKGYCWNNVLSKTWSLCI